MNRWWADDVLSGVKPIHWISAVAAAVLLLTAVVLVPGTVEEPAPPVPASCPQRWESNEIGRWVPAPADLDGVEDSLVPGTPTSALICAYPGQNSNPGRESLAGSRTLTDQAKSMAYDLGYLPVTTERIEKVCTLIGGQVTNYLIRFAYPDGQALWVGSAEEINSCVTTTNGTVASDSYIGPSITAAYRTGTWKLLQPKDPCDPTTGRRGQNEQMVPDGAIKVLVCREVSSGNSTPRPSHGPEHGEQQARELAAELNSLDAEPGGNTCREVGGGQREMLYLHFGYEEGPSAWVRINPGCRPSVNNGVLVGDLNDALLAQMDRLAPPA
ncbi:hypothetical protein [Nonomuraea jiangxiensis]|uniref:Uncharacterized protein n=1 Tax=Nonomuraea jiangxiensis TaxID=633440 RepID=A0A1G8YB83_9ACTN|nr:hypothetical protein [Nonomuraea jiangxiensis]SDJ99947.1 hypothetical protein SAMN05421869_113223 [Nonomuraea jiangxiensis]